MPSLRWKRSQQTELVKLSFILQHQDEEVLQREHYFLYVQYLPVHTVIGVPTVASSNANKLQIYVILTKPSVLVPTY